MAPQHGSPPSGAQPPGVPAHYDYPRVPVTRLLDDAAQDFPESAGLDVGGHRLTYRQVLDQVDRLATALSTLGVAPGSRIGVVLDAPAPLLLAAFAAWRLGAVVVLVDPDGAPARVAAELTAHGCQVVVIDAARYAALVAAGAAITPVRHVLVSTAEEYLPFPRNLARPARSHWRRGRGVGRDEAAEGFKDAIRRTAPSVAQAPVARDATAAVIAGVRVGHHEIVAASFQLRLWVPDVQAGRENLLLAARPWRPFGLTSLVGLGVLAAATVTVPSSPDLHRALRAVRRRRPTLLVIDAAATGWLDDPPSGSASLRVVLADAPVDPEQARRLHDATGARLRGGLAGPSGLVAANPVYGRAQLGSAGLALPDTWVAALATDGTVVPAGGTGALAAAGVALPRAGWWPLGIRGCVDADGYVWLDAADAG